MMKTDGKGFFLIIEKVNTIPVIQNASKHDLCKAVTNGGSPLSFMLHFEVCFEIWFISWYVLVHKREKYQCLYF